MSIAKAAKVAATDGHFRVKEQVPEVHTKTSSEVKTKTPSTFESLELAHHIINPVLRTVSGMMRRASYGTLPGSLNRLTQWLLRMERGNRHVNRTPLFHNMSFAAVSKMITNLVSAAERSTTKAYGNPEYTKLLTEVEDHQAKKIGPRGVFPPAHVWLPSKIEQVWCDKLPNKDLNREALARSLDWLSKLISPHSIDVDESSLDEGFKNVGTDSEDSRSLNTDTNSCYPDYVRHWYHAIWDKSVSLIQRMVQVKLVKEARAIWLRALKCKSEDECRKLFHFVATANQRTNVSDGHEISDDGKNTYKGVIVSKLRFVCAMPKIDTIIGKVFLNRLMDAAKTLRNPDGTRIFVALTTPQQIDKSMEVCLETAHKNGVTALSTDFSSFDSTIAPWLVMEVARAISVWFTPRAARIFTSLVYGAFYQTSCISPTKIYPEGPSSMKSGSWLTNIMDSFVNLIGQRYGLEAGHFKSILNQFVQGDDGILSGVGINPETFEKSSAELGFVANKDKQFFQPDALSFCQKIHYLGFPGGVYPVARALNAIISLEDDVPIETDESKNFPYVLSFRTVCRMGSACFNPNFVSFVNLVKDDDSIHLGADMPAAKLAKLAGSYATKYQRESIDKPWKALGLNEQGGFARLPVNRVLRGDLPPSPGRNLYEWVYGQSYDSVEL